MTSVVALAALCAAYVADGVSATSGVHKVTLTASVWVGDPGSLTVKVSPKARCTIAVANAVPLGASGLAPKSGGRITWRWRMSGDAEAGLAPVTVRCGKSGTLATKLRIMKLSGADAAKAVCARTPARVKALYGVDLPSGVPVVDGFSCEFRYIGNNVNGQPQSGLYRVEVREARHYTGKPTPPPCTFEVAAGTSIGGGANIRGSGPLPVNEIYMETCKSLS
jgi:hypothetical protein